MNSLISVIIPVYNVEAYLDACVRSVVNQTYTELEILLVDDGSTDRSGALCDVWAARDARIRVIHKANGGLSDARNAGLEAARGAYIAFVDSDDRIAETMLEELCSALERAHAGIAECGYTQFEAETEPAFREGAGGALRSFEAEEALAQLLDGAALQVVVWNKLYRGELFRTLRFEVGKLHEDVFFTYQAFGLCGRAAKTEAVLYGYRQRSGSIMGTRFSLRRLDAVEANRRQYFYMRAHFPALAPKAQSNALGISIWLGQCALREAEPGTAAEALAAIRPVFSELYDAQKVQDTPKQRFWFALARRNLTICCRVRNALGIGL